MPHKLSVWLAGDLFRSFGHYFSANPSVATELPLPAYTRLAQSVLKSEVLPRLFYSGAGEGKSAEIEVVESGHFLP